MIICYWRKLRKPRNNLPPYWKYENGSSVANHCCQPEISSVGRVPVLYTASRWFNPSISELSRKNYKQADCESISAMGKHLETGAFLHLQKINKKVY